MSNYYLGTVTSLIVFYKQNLTNNMNTLKIPIDVHKGPLLEDMMFFDIVQPAHVEPFESVVRTLQRIMDRYPDMIVRGSDTELHIDNTAQYNPNVYESQKNFFAYDKMSKVLIYKEPLQCIDNPDHYHFQKHIMFLRGLFDKLNAPIKKKFTYNGDGFTDVYEVEYND